MRTFVSTAIVGLTLVATPALAQQHPWVASGTPVYGQPNPAIQQHPWVPSAYAGSLSSGDLARAESSLRDAGARQHLGRERAK